MLNGVLDVEIVDVVPAGRGMDLHTRLLYYRIQVAETDERDYAVGRCGLVGLRDVRLLVWTAFGVCMIGSSLVVETSLGSTCAERGEGEDVLRSVERGASGLVVPFALVVAIAGCNGGSESASTSASPESLVWPELSIDDYARRSEARRQWWSAQDGQQAGDLAKLAAALIALSDADPPPRRFIAGADVIALAQQRIELLRQDIESHRTLSESLIFDE